jgi:membrane fusion protein (multidrug efflux system)
MKKRILYAILGLIVLAAVLGGVKVLQIRAMIDQAKKAVLPPETVTTAEVASESWETSLVSVGSLAAVQGVTVAAELAGKVVEITFEAGTKVKRGDLLIRQDTSSEEAQLPGAVAQANLARTVLTRDAEMLADRIISESDYDAAVAAYEQAMALANGIRTTIGKKTIRAPFSGRLGIRQVNLGQILREGDPIVTLQSLDPIYVNFTLPQQELGALRAGLPVRMTSDALPGTPVEGRITAVNPLVDADTRNIQVQATISNRGEKLRPGMFVNVAVGLPARKKVLAIPSTAVLYAPYGDSVFLVADGKEGKGKVLRQQFVRLGEKRGDFVSVIDGLKEGEVVVSTGVFKLRNGQAAVVDNRLELPFRQAPTPKNN